MSSFKHSSIFKLLVVSIIASIVTFAFLGSLIWDSFQNIEATGQSIFKIQALKSTIVYYDEVLTMSANMYVVTGDRKWNRRYLEYKPKLDATINDLKTISPDILTLRASKSTEEANLKLVEKEFAAFALVANGDEKGALAILNSSNYRQQKDIYRKGMLSIESYLQKQIEKMLHRQHQQNTSAYIKIAITIAIFIIIYILGFRITKNYFDELIRSRETIKQNEYFVNAIVENIPDMIFVKESEHLRFVRINKAGERLLGYSRSDLIGKSDHDFFPKNEADFFTKIDREVLQNKNLLDIPSEGIHTNNNKEKILHTKKIPILDSHNEPKYLLGISEDITERMHANEENKQLEKRLHRAERMEAIGLMAGGVAHDLNNILSGIVGYPELLLLKLPQESPLRQPIEAIWQSGRRASAVVSDLLTVARGVASVRETLSLNRIIQEYLNSPEFQSLAKTCPKITFLEQLNADNPFVSCSHIHIMKIIMNLVTNSVEAVKDSGEISISTSNTYIDKFAGAALDIKEGYYVLLGVSDSGVGISCKDLPHIFEPFYTKKELQRSGTGLGLAVVWNAVKDHNGAILVESDTNGSCFKIYFPVSNAIFSESITENKIDLLRGSGERVLIVDDEPSLRDISCQMLRYLGYEADSVSSGELAINYVKEKPVDLLVIDMLMKPGMSGYQTFKEIRELYPEQTAIIASGFSESEDVKAALQLGASRFIPKPYSMEKLGQSVKEALSHRNRSHKIGG